MNAKPDNFYKWLAPPRIVQIVFVYPVENNMVWYPAVLRCIIYYTLLICWRWLCADCLFLQATCKL